MVQPAISVLLVSMPGISQHMMGVAFEGVEGMEVVDLASGGLSAFNSLEMLRPDVVVIDSNIPEQEMIQLIKIIKEKHPSAISLVLTNTTLQMQNMIRQGADLSLRGMDFLAKRDYLLDEIRARVAKRAL